jgi:hypothetical protein
MQKYPLSPTLLIPSWTQEGDVRQIDLLGGLDKLAILALRLSDASAMMEAAVRRLDPRFDGGQPPSALMKLNRPFDPGEPPSAVVKRGGDGFVQSHRDARKQRAMICIIPLSDGKMPAIEAVNELDGPSGLLTDTGPMAKAGKEASLASAPVWGLARVYCRCVGLIQWIYAAFFGFWACAVFGDVYYHLTITPGKFKDAVWAPYLDTYELAIGILFTLLCICCVFGGGCLILLRPAARRWEIVYLAFFIVMFVTLTGFDVRTLMVPKTVSEELWVNFRFFLSFTLPYLPFLFRWPRPYQWPLLGKPKSPKFALDELAG